jgi:hypothetical protein
MKALSLLAVLTLASCQALPSDFLSLEARAIVVDDAEGDLAGLGEDDVELTGYGVHAALMTGIVDVVAGIDQREFETNDTPELDIGLRKRLFGLWKLDTYIEANWRYGVDLETQTTSEDYFGYSVGFGALLDLDGTYFLNFRAMYDSTSIDVANTSVDVEGLIGTVGIGIKL